ncbi:MAG: hypothetical protein HPY54_13095 [Chthonomonadetes bacterium]|jgi:hypothetical protein|nr:hypothetical protein [Chthonomonadetes bacterium]
MKRFRMKKQKIVKPDGRWMYMYTFEEVQEQHPAEKTEQPAPQTSSQSDAR